MFFGFTESDRISIQGPLIIPENTSLTNPENSMGGAGTLVFLNQNPSEIVNRGLVEPSGQLRVSNGSFRQTSTRAGTALSLAVAGIGTPLFRVSGPMNFEAGFISITDEFRGMSTITASAEPVLLMQSTQSLIIINGSSEGFPQGNVIFKDLTRGKFEVYPIHTANEFSVGFMPAESNNESEVVIETQAEVVEFQKLIMGRCDCLHTDIVGQGMATASADASVGFADGDVVGAPALRPQQIDVGRFWAKPLGLPATVYLVPVGSWGKVDGTQTTQSAKFYTAGGALGADYAFANVGLGAFVGYEWAKGTEACQFGSNHTHTVFAHGYGAWLPLPDRHFFIDFNLGGSRNWYTFYRTIDCLRTATGKPRGWEYDGYLGIGYNIDMRREWRLTPITGIQYTNVRIDGFTETGAEALNHVVDRFKTHSWLSWLGGTFGGKLERNKVIWMPEVSGFWLHEFAGLCHSLTVFSPCFNSCKNEAVLVGDRNYGIAGVKLRLLFGPKYRWIVSGAYDYFWSRHVHTNYLYGSFGMNF